MYSFHIGPALILAEVTERDEEQAVSRFDKENGMAGRYVAALLLLGVLCWHGPAGGAGATIVQSRQLADNQAPLSSKCIARCNDLNVECEELVKRFPSCSVVDICFEERLQCEAQCRGISDATSGLATVSFPAGPAQVFTVTAAGEAARALEQ
jgi:hypothetical protein